MIMIIKKDFNRNNNNESYFNEKELRNLHYNMNENIIMNLKINDANFNPEIVKFY